MSPPAALLDVDGTLVDTNYHHALAWYRAFRRHDVVLPLWRIHRHMGMGGDQLVASLCGDEAEQRIGDAVRAAEEDLYMELIDEVEPLPRRARPDRGAEAPRARRRARQLGEEHEVDHYLDLLDARELVDGWTTVGRRRAHEAASRPGGRREGEGGWRRRRDARRLDLGLRGRGRGGVPTMGLLTGGFSEQELRQAGAGAVFESIAD